jgi:anti-sigma factor ChrR (cupin superfamily)
MSLLNKILLSCQKATFLVSKQQETSLDLKETLQLKVHLMMCDVCTKWKAQTDTLTKVLKNNSDQVIDPNAALTQEQKQKLSDTIDKYNA